MEQAAPETSFAWQPFTPRGVAAFAGAPTTRLLLVQAVMALAASLAVMWVLHARWFPVITNAVRRFPSAGEARAAKLDWRGDSPQLLSEGRCLAVSVDLRHEGGARSPAHIQLEFGERDVRLISLFGYYSAAYPSGWIIFLNRPAAEPRWGAWAPAVLALAGAIVFLALMLSWTVLAFVYSWLVWLGAYFANRDLRWSGCWRIAGAGLMPGALVEVLLIILYGLGALDLLGLLIASALHFAIGWIYSVAAVWVAPRNAEGLAAAKNPFENH
jgi:hypothetical protein